MNLSNILATSLLSLTIVGTNIPSSQASELINNEITLIHQDCFGSDSWINTRTQIASYTDVEFPGEYKNSFGVFSNKYDLRYCFANKGEFSFTWKILSPSGVVWAKGNLSPGQSKTYTAFHDMDYIPIGEYTFSIISSNGGEGLFDFFTGF